MKRLRGAIIGCGYFGRIHLAAWQRMPEVELVAACDLNFELLTNLGLRAYESAESMLQCEVLDFVDIATRPCSHLPLVKLTMRHRLPTICQKPMAPTWADAVDMVETAERADVLLMIHENWRWQPWYRAVRKMIDRGDIGTPVSYWFRTRDRDGVGTQPYPKQSYFRRIERFLIDEALVHHLDTARFLFGGIKRKDPVDTIALESGDAFVFGGPARLRYHGVSRTVPGSAPPALAISGRFNLTFRQYDVVK